MKQIVEITLFVIIEAVIVVGFIYCIYKFCNDCKEQRRRDKTDST